MITSHHGVYNPPFHWYVHYKIYTHTLKLLPFLSQIYRIGLFALKNLSHEINTATIYVKWSGTYRSGTFFQCFSRADNSLNNGGIIHNCKCKWIFTSLWLEEDCYYQNILSLKPEREFVFTAFIWIFLLKKLQNYKTTVLLLKSLRHYTWM